MNIPWSRKVTFPGQLKLFGLDCPFCGEEKQYLVSMTFAEGIAPICEQCRSYSNHADMYVFPTLDEFRKRLAP